MIYLITFIDVCVVVQSYTVLSCVQSLWLAQKNYRCCDEWIAYMFSNQLQMQKILVIASKTQIFTLLLNTQSLRTTKWSFKW